MQNQLLIDKTAFSCIKDIFVHSGKMKSIIALWDLIIIEIEDYALCLGNIPKDFTINNRKKQDFFWF